MIKTNLKSLTRAEIAQRGAKASLACYFLTLLTIGLSLFVQSLFIFFLALAMASMVFAQTQMSKRVSTDPLVEKNWNLLRLCHWLFSIISSLVLLTTVSQTDNPLHLIVMFSILVGTAGHFIFITTLDKTLIFLVLVILFLPLISISIFHYQQQNTASNLVLLVVYISSLIYSLIQYRFLRFQLMSNLNIRLQLEKFNSELKHNDQKQDFFIQLVLTLLNNKAPLETIFNSIISFFESQNRGWVCSILFLNKNKTRFDQVYAPSMDHSYNQAITNLDVGPTAGSCGTAAYLGERVIVEDIRTSPLWAAYPELAKAAKLAACWSQPIKDKNSNVLGAFAIYHHSPHFPSENDVRMIEQAAELVAIVLQHLDTEEMVRKTQEDFSLVYNSSIDSMWLMDVEEGHKFRFRTVNDAFTLATGIQREQVLNKLIEEVLPPQLLESTKARYLEVVANRKVIDYLDVAVFPIGTKAGQIRLKPILDENGICTKILGITQDVTEKQKMTELLSQHETDLMYAQKVARLGNWKWDISGGKNNFTSKEVISMLEIDENSNLPVSITDVNMFTEESWAKAMPLIESAIANGTYYEIDLERKMKSGQHRWFTARGEVVERDASGKPTLLAGAIQDITERKVLENNLKAALKSRDEFIAVASHELKTPLTTIQLSLYGIGKNIESGGQSPLAEQIHPKLSRATLQTERLATLVDNLLDVARMGSGKIHMDFQRDTNLSELTLTVLKKYEEEIARFGSTLTKVIDPLVVGNWDKGRLEQVVTNLLTNAIKYGASKPIEISLRVVNDSAELVVRDNGIGIPENKQNKIFGRFERAVNETNYQGLGLGLWIVSEILAAHNGSIKVESTDSRGSVFTATIPLSGGTHE